MRISNSTLTNMMTGSMGSSYDTYVNAVQKIVTNKNFTKVSENPAGAEKVLKFNDQLSQLDIYQSNINAATNEMNYAYDALGSISDELTTINSLIIEASNSTTSKDSAKAIAAEIKERVGTIKDKLNAKYLDNYIFSGTYTSTKAFDEVKEEGEEEGVIKYLGSSEKAGNRKLTISEDTQFVYNITGASIFGDQNYYFEDENGVKQEVSSDFFSQMKELDNLLNADTLDYNKIRQKIQVTTNGVENVTRAQGSISAQVSKLDTTKNLNESTILNLTSNKADIEEVDIVKAASDLASAQTAMQASYTLGMRVLNNVSLLNYL